MKQLLTTVLACLALLGTQPTFAREFDAETGLVHMGAREYDPETGRFLQADPITNPEKSINTTADSIEKTNQEFYHYSSAGGAIYGSSNLYQYAFSNPTNWTDPFGTAPLPIGWLLPIINAIANPANAPGVGEPTYVPVITDAQLETLIGLGLGYYVGEDACSAINQNRFLRIGPGRRGGERVFRLAGQWIEQLTGKTHIDLWIIGPL